MLCLGGVIACSTSTVLERAAGIPTPYWRNKPPRAAAPVRSPVAVSDRNLVTET